MTARVHRLLRGSLGAVLGLLGCSFNAVGLGEGEPGVSDGMTTDLSSGGPAPWVVKWIWPCWPST